MLKFIGRIVKLVLVVIIAFVVFVIWDNHRIKIVEQEIHIEALPGQLEGFRILQVSDLHEKEFGKNQRRLIKKINSIDYDVLVFTGDMMDEINSTNYEAVYSIIEGIENKQMMLYVPGNADPYSYEIEPSFGKSDFIKGMEERGVTLLESVASLEVEGSAVHFVEFELAIIKRPEFVSETEGIVQPPYVVDPQFMAHHKKLWEEMTLLDDTDPSDVVIALNHYPVVDNRIDFIKDEPIHFWREFDLIMAGHYHGGQIRLPFKGAIFVPEAWYESGGIFPPENRVKGLWEYEGTKQYVSTGLGSSDAISFLNFRLFNPPEINVVELVRQRASELPPE
ncbi:metallophosphoesterase [Ornithinibacillus californiensis]|uniref:metallophosphoesterase n=1 Tax=Ornithinibacillus californiensis TaxID=161536 RepID=UPI00064D884A|nr:metallophosphoesterase [Ornithinibacillus californiensis]